ncbi:MAG: hypothetical protein MZV64_10885 [Ignavibacteriales bacterium]|nr:hypothetical protein [Ignavibacteriales bacterium]
MAVQNGYFPLFEIEDGEKYTLNLKLKDKKPVDDYIRLQGRFRHLKPEQVAVDPGRRRRPLGAPAEARRRLSSRRDLVFASRQRVAACEEMVPLCFEDQVPSFPKDFDLPRPIHYNFDSIYPNSVLRRAR